MNFIRRHWYSLGLVFAVLAIAWIVLGDRGSPPTGNSRPSAIPAYGGGAEGIPADSPDAVQMLMTMAIDTLQAYPF